MADIYKIAEKLNLDNRIIKLMKKEILLPNYIDDLNPVTDYWYPHPPCLIPLFLGHGASYKGIINHFFCDRKLTFVEYFLEHGYISEIARNAEQFITLIVLRMIITKDGLTEEIIDFCKKVGLEKYEEIDQFTLDFGDEPQEFKHLVYFKDNRPFKYVKELEGYNGDFPSSIYILNRSIYLQNASQLEIAPTEQLSKIEDLSPWLKENENKKNLFDTYLSNNKLKEAWLTLNSKGWLLKDVANGLQQLKQKTNDERFSIVADYWLDGWNKSTFLDGEY
ncbi:hypothetical protein ACFOWA_14510 [Pedobacter lithocola]|uniref:Uncharacterized protein n=1 Tax=Pedobacter lithocola TaxID=1908239 RepID=A0ABV8PB44_9SPHI